jgi:hypothetical protein
LLFADCQVVLLLLVSQVLFLATVVASYDASRTCVCLLPTTQVELIADELKGWADRDILQQLQEVVGQVLEPEQQKVVTGMFGL